MLTNLDHLREEAEHVILQVGDLIYDVRTKSRGFLKKRERRIDIIEDDIYVWWVVWISQDKDNDYNNLDYIEEEGLIMSIVIGIVKLYSINQGE